MRESDVENARERIRRAMTEVATAVAVITTDGPAGRRAITVSTALPLPGDVAHIVACVPRTHPIASAIATNEEFTASYLAIGHEPLASGASAGHDPSPDGVAGAVASFDCRIDHTIALPDHLLLVGRIVDGRGTNDAEPLVQFRGDFRRIEELPHAVFTNFARPAASRAAVEAQS